MIVRLKTVTGLPEHVDLGISLFRDTVAGCCVDVVGFRAGWFLVDRDSGRTVTLTMWDDRDALAEALGNLADRIASDEHVAETVRRVNANGMRTDTFEVAEQIAPRPRQ